MFFQFLFWNFQRTYSLNCFFSHPIHRYCSFKNKNPNFTDDSHIISENLSQQKRRPQAATAGRSRNLAIATDNDMEEDDQSTISW